MPHILIATLSLSVLVAGCSGAEPPASTLPPETGAILAAAAATMGNVDTVRFGIERSGVPVYIDPADALAFEMAEGRFSAPAAADAVVTISIGELKTSIGAVAIDGETWLTNPITGKFEPAPPGFTFDPATLFDPDRGWRPLLASGLADVELIGLEPRDQGDLYHLRGVADRDRVAVITAGLVTGQDVTLDLWLRPADGAVIEAFFPTFYRGGESQWRLTFGDYGAEFTIELPELDG